MSHHLPRHRRPLVFLTSFFGFLLTTAVSVLPGAAFAQAIRVSTAAASTTVDSREAAQRPASGPVRTHTVTVVQATGAAQTVAAGHSSDGRPPSAPHQVGVTATLAQPRGGLRAARPVTAGTALPAGVFQDAERGRAPPYGTGF